jgi:adenylate kinase
VSLAGGGHLSDGVRVSRPGGRQRGLGLPEFGVGLGERDDVVRDGPGDLAAAAALDAMLSDLGTPIDRAIDLVLSDAEVQRRLAGRRTCRGCGRLWHTEFAAPARPDVCDRCGGELFPRYDDSPERITAGLRSYRPAAAVTLNHYGLLGKLISIDATLTPEEITAKALA